MQTCCAKYTLDIICLVDITFYEQISVKNVFSYLLNGTIPALRYVAIGGRGVNKSLCLEFLLYTK